MATADRIPVAKAALSSSMINKSGAYCHYTRGCGCSGTRHSLRPLIGGGGKLKAKPRALRAARANSFQELERRHCEEPLRRSNPAFFLRCASRKLDCFASLAMTASRPTHAHSTSSLPGVQLRTGARTHNRRRLLWRALIQEGPLAPFAISRAQHMVPCVRRDDLLRGCR
jgi:hypothetical protein